MGAGCISGPRTSSVPNGGSSAGATGPSSSVASPRSYARSSRSRPGSRACRSDASRFSARSVRRSGASASQARVGRSGRATRSFTTTSGMWTSPSACCSSWPRLPGMSAAGGRLNWLDVAQIPLVDVKAQYAPLLDELKERIAEVLDSGRFILGPHVRAFEGEAAAYLGVKHAIGVANGTDAIVLALDALGIGEGDEVICPSFTFYASAEAIARRGAAPVFVDIDPQTMNLDAGDVRRRMTGKTKAIMPVHLFGRPAPLEELAELGVPLVEDAAQAFGAQGTGRAGIVSTYSFFPTKNLFAFGDGGLVSTDDDELAERVRLLRFHGSKAKKE